MNPISPFLERQGFVVVDGGLATEMEARGADLDHFLWSARMLAERPALVREVHAAYLAAGADVIATATYQASATGFARAGFGGAEADRLMRLAVELAVEARDRFLEMRSDGDDRIRPLVAASIGPYGACLHDGSEYHGRYEAAWSEVEAFHAERLDRLAETSADLFAFETVPSRAEAEILLALLTRHPDRRAWLSFSCRDGGHDCHGEPFADCAALADGVEQVVAVGLNCTAPEFVADLLDAASDVRTPLIVYPNSGEHWIAAENRWAGECGCAWPVEDWYRRGARLIGGCCRTGPEDVRRVRGILTRLAENA